MNERKPTRSPDGFLLDVKTDVPDIRDRPYEPTLARLQPEMPPPADLHIRDQGREGACTGFGLAAVIDLLNSRRGKSVQVSARMLYEMARQFDEWPGENYSGSSCRGAIRGWRSMGVCTEQQWPYKPGETSELTVERAKAAREHTVGAYYRVRREIADFHAALNEAGVVFVSADVHSGWSIAKTKAGEIPYRDQEYEGGHAFAIVGYNDKGFWVQNSWGRDWGNEGVALWYYEDWHRNVRDAWVVSLALSTPQIYALPPSNYDPTLRKEQWLFDRGPARTEIIGHYAHLDDGRFHEHSPYGSKLSEIRQTAALVAASGKYRHLLLYAHGGLNNPVSSARRISAMKRTFKSNGIYPFHFMYDTGLVEEIKDILFGKRKESTQRMEGISDYSDRMLEYSTRPAGRALWREMKRGATKAFDTDHAGLLTLKCFLDELAGDSGMKIHLVGHSTGAIFMAHLLDTFRQLAPNRSVATCSLMAPAATVHLFNSHYRPYLVQSGNGFHLEKMVIYNLTDPLERDDTVKGIYRKSLLYLVSNAYEDNLQEGGVPLLGMQRHCAELEQGIPRFEIVYSTGTDTRDARTASTSHGGFDNDPCTMNDILRTILGTSPAVPFTEATLKY